ncbi:hypothetical protein ADEAN_000717500 [Angomonas deanei]|uniref:Uncharacterized protein n=1 Tax=Angomonas deanei TaxID=59799 RepID=A0A7G2CIR7_9TRYP|nr:hypothetical protein ADEAN_000717500 [Angomonas deanei]
MDPSEALLNSNEKQAAEIRARERKNRQKANVAELQKKTLEMESNLKAKEGPKTIENMLDEVLMHMAYARLEKKDGEVVEVPPPEEGGTLALLNRGGDDARRKSRRQSSIKRSSSARRSTVQSAGGKKGKDGEEAAEVSPASVHWDTMKAAADRYGNVWQGKFRESYIEGGDLNQAMDEEILRKQLLEGPLRGDVRTPLLCGSTGHDGGWQLEGTSGGGEEIQKEEGEEGKEAEKTKAERPDKRG